MICTVGETERTVAKVIEETNLQDHHQKMMEALDPFDRTQFTNIGAVLFLTRLSLILLGSNNKEDVHFQMVMSISRQGRRKGKVTKMEC